ncbi:MAG: BON domain-containing protein [Elainellaceae cyanobacterium]
MNFTRASSNPIAPDSIFSTIPPERIGLDGTYDHYGLAHRVASALEQQLGTQVIQRLKITQRGSVVVVVGDLPTTGLLPQIIGVAMNMAGTTDVEFNGISIARPLKQTV